MLNPDSEGKTGKKSWEEEVTSALSSKRLVGVSQLGSKRKNIPGRPSCRGKGPEAGELVVSGHHKCFILAGA